MRLQGQMASDIGKPGVIADFEYLLGDQTREQSILAEHANNPPIVENWDVSVTLLHHLDHSRPDPVFHFSPEDLSYPYARIQRQRRVLDSRDGGPERLEHGVTWFDKVTLFQLRIVREKVPHLPTVIQLGRDIAVTRLLVLMSHATGEASFPRSCFVRISVSSLLNKFRNSCVLSSPIICPFPEKWRSFSVPLPDRGTRMTKYLPKTE